MDGKQLFLSGIADDGSVLLAMDPSGGTRLLLKNPTGWTGFPVPSPDGKRIAYTYGVFESNVTLLEHF
jgi:Tol biopolymer transport system component